MTTTNTQPAGCDLDTAYNVLSELFHAAGKYKAAVEGDTLGDQNEEDLTEALSDAEHWLLTNIPSAAQAPQGDTRQGVPAGWSMKEFGNGAFSISRIGGQSATFMPFGTPEEVIKHAFVTALLATPAAHTCTPADEQARPEPWEDRLKRQVTPAVFDSMSEGYRVSQGAGHVLAEVLEWRARAAQGAGTAPVGLTDQMLENLDSVIGAVENNDTITARGIRQLYPVEDARKAIEILRAANHPAPVSTAAAPEKTILHLRWRQEHAEWRECMSDCPGAVEFVGVVPAGYVGVAPAATVSTAAATTASASAQDAQYEVVVDRRDLFDFLRAAWREGSSVGWVDTAESWHKATDYADEVIKGWGTMRDVAPSRAADGQQGASRAVLDVLDDLDTYDPERDMPGVMEVRNKYKDGDYYKVEDVRAAIAQSRAQSDTTGENHG